MANWENAQIGSALGGGAGGLVGGIATLLGAGGSGGDPMRAKAVSAWEKLKAVDFDFTKIAPADLQVLQQMRPDLVEMVLPLQAPEIQDSIQGRGAQVASLGRLEQYAREGMPVEEKGAIMDAQRRIGGQIQMGQNAALRDLAERGRLGAGDEAAARMLQAQGSSDLAGQFGQSLAELISGNRYKAAGDVANLGSTIRGQDVDLAKARATQAQNYNDLVANILNQGAFANQAAKQQAQAYNVNQANTVYGIQKPLNVQQTQQANLGNQNALRQQGYENKLQQLRGYTGALTGQAETEDQKRANKEQAFGNIGRGIFGAAGTALGAFL